MLRELQTLLANAHKGLPYARTHPRTAVCILLVASYVSSPPAQAFCFTKALQSQILLLAERQRSQSYFSQLACCTHGELRIHCTELYQWRKQNPERVSVRFVTSHQDLGLVSWAMV